MALFAVTLLAAGCESGAATGTGSPGVPRDGTTGTSGGGTSAVIAGTWFARLIYPVPVGDFLQNDVTWAFRTDRSCRQTIESLLYSEGTVELTVRECTYALNQGVVLVHYQGAAEPVTYTFSIPLNDSNTLVLSGIAYERVP